MSSVVYEKVIELASKYKNLHIRLGGGEPTLVMDKWLKPMWELKNKHNSTVYLLTNLKKIPIDFLAKCKGLLSISVSINDTSNLGNVEKLLPLFNVYAMTTLGKHKNPDLFKIRDFIVKNKLGWRVATDYFGKVYAGFSKDVIKLFDRKPDINFNHMNFVGREGCSVCKNIFAVGTQGNLYKCHTELNGKPIGNILTQDPISVLKNYKYTEKRECKFCSAYLICWGWCKLNFVPNKAICDEFKKIILNIGGKHVGLPCL